MDQCEYVRRLLEAYPSEGNETWFLVEPSGEGCTVTIGTDFSGRSGIAGMIERWMAHRLLHPIYVEELGLLENYALDLARHTARRVQAQGA